MENFIFVQCDQGKSTNFHFFSDLHEMLINIVKKVFLVFMDL